MKDKQVDSHKDKTGSLCARLHLPCLIFLWRHKMNIIFSISSETAINRIGRYLETRSVPFFSPPQLRAHAACCLQRLFLKKKKHIAASKIHPVRQLVSFIISHWADYRFGERGTCRSSPLLWLMNKRTSITAGWNWDGQRSCDELRRHSIYSSFGALSKRRTKERKSHQIGARRRREQMQKTHNDFNKRLVANLMGSSPWSSSVSSGPRGSANRGRASAITTLLYTFNVDIDEAERALSLPGAWIAKKKPRK